MSFKKVVREACEENALKYLKLHIKSKGKELKYNQMELRHYLTSSSHLTLQEKKDLFKMRTRMTDVKSNFKNKYESLNCDKCEENNEIKEETQEHVYKCIDIKENQKMFETIFTNTHETKTLKIIIQDFLNGMKERKKIS